MKRVLLILLAVILASSMLFMGIGCKEEDVEKTTEEVAEENTEETAGEVTEKTIEEVEEVKEPKTIVYWSLWNDTEPNAAVVQSWVDQYEKLNPHITIEVAFSGRKVITNSMPAIAAGETIDILAGRGLAIMTTLVNTGETLSVEEFNQYLDGPDYTGDSIWRDTFAPGTLEQFPGVLPLVRNTALLSINKAKWEEKGWKIPETWDEFLAVCEEIENDGEMDPIAMEGGALHRNFTWYYMLIERLKGPGFLISAVEDKTGETWEDPAFATALEMLRELFDKGYIYGDESSAGFQAPQAEVAFAQGDAAMFLSGSWVPVQQMNTVDEDWVWGAFPVPSVAGGDGSRYDNENFFVGRTIIKSSKVIPEAIDFLKFTSTVEMQQLWSDESLSLSPIKGVVPPVELEDVNDILLKMEQSFLAYDGIRGFHPKFSSDIMFKNFTPAFFGEITIDEYVEAMKADTIEFWKNQ